ncbi:putative autotransporter adhesin-like protein [Maribacter vaceletii]|uniref:Putative autotransporter adhesin-like protein n=1 Tax=Maribacter vaceletii TaxID=1206816 RepID=A0A495E844_9FLAO|nr:head GIN domain-containing protein [Maribacter vaceletii]RKR12966.1 putative autotransporter adhesin-like protein [Maribacter vaceletii]
MRINQNQLLTKTIFFKVIIVLITATTLLSCEDNFIRASGDIETREYSFSEFNSIEVSNDFNAYVHFTEGEESVEIEANSNVFRAIRIDQEGSNLKIRLKNFVVIKGKETLNVYISAKNITNYKVSTDAKIELEDKLISNNVFIEAFANGSFKGEVEAENIEVKLSADSKVDLFGSATKLKAKLTADSELRNYDLEVEDLNIDLLADSRAYLSVSNTIDVEAKANSRLYYKGDAEITHEKVNSGSKLIHKD